VCAVDVVRFFWDVLDTSDDTTLGGLSDDTDLRMNSLTAAFEGMPCTGTDFGVSGSCNEFDLSATTCAPASDTAAPVGWTRSRDSYNVFDLGLIIAGDQTNERKTNCVGDAAN